MSFALGKPVEKGVIKQVTARQEILQNPERAVDGGFGFFAQKMPWVRLTSAIDIAGSDENAKLNILTNGINLAGESVVPGYQDSATLGIRPKPGITAMNLNTHNRFGSLRTATVQFTVPSVEQLDVYEQLFMRPGYSALLEWGHSKYLDSESPGYPVKDIPLLLDFFKTGASSPKTKTQIYQNLENLRETYRYNYDGMYGLVKNFSWSLQQDGTYACSVDIVSIGSVLESLNINVAVTNEEISKYATEAAADTREERLEEIRELRGTVDIEDGVATESIEGSAPETESDKLLAEFVMKYFEEIAAGKPQALQQIKDGNPVEGGIELFGITEDFDGTSGAEITVPNNFRTENNRYYYDNSTFSLIGAQNSPAPTIRIITPPIFYNVKQGQMYYVNYNGRVNTPYDANRNPIKPNNRGSQDSAIRRASEASYGAPIPSAYVLQFLDEGGTVNYELTDSTVQTLNDMKLTGNIQVQAAVIEYVYTLKPQALDLTTIVTPEPQEDEIELPPSPLAEDAEDSLDLTNIFEIVASDKQPLKTRIHYILSQAKRKIDNDRPAGVSTRDRSHTLTDADMHLIKISSNYLKLHSKSVTIEANDDSGKTTQNHYSYVQLGFLFDIFNSLLPTNGDNGERLFEFYTGTSIKHFLKTIKQFHYSVDTSKCLLPSEGGAVDVLSIFVEISYIEAVIESYFSTGKVPLYEVLKTICNDISISVGSFSDLQVQYFETTNRYHLVDREVLDPDAVEEEYPVLSIFGKNSFVRGLNLTSKLSPNIGSQLAIAAQADPRSNGIESSAWQYFNEDLTDRFIQQKVDIVTRKQAAAAAAKAESEDREEKLKVYAEVFDYLRATYPKEGTAFYNYRRAVDSVVPQYAVFCQKQLVEDIADGRDFGFIIPYELSLTVEGMSGFNVMESFKIFDNLIPSVYKSNSKNGIAFIITGLTHSISTSGWTTTIKSQIYNTNSSGRRGAPIIKDAETGLTPPPISTAEGATKNLDRGWEGKQQAFQRTILSYADAAAAIKAATSDTNLQRSILAVIIKEQGRGGAIYGFNHNYGGYDITSGGWRFSSFGESTSNGYVYAIEGGTKLKKAFVSFVSAEVFFKKKLADFQKRGFDQADTSRKAAETWYKKWNGYGARIHWENNYKGYQDTYATLQEYDEYVITNFEKTYKKAVDIIG